MALDLSHLSYRPLSPPPLLGGTGGTRHIYSDGQASFGSSRHHLLEGEAGQAEHPDPDFLWLERSKFKLRVRSQCSGW